MTTNAPDHTAEPSSSQHGADRSGVRLRDAVATLPAYVPGARMPAGQRAFKLSSNENPFPPLPSVVDAIIAGAGESNRYPDLAAVDLVEALAARLSRSAPRPVTPAEIVVGTGSVGVLEHLLDAVCDPGDEVLVPWRSFEAYPIAVAVAGARFVPLPLQEGHDERGCTVAGRLDLVTLAAAVGERTRVVVVCTPNNPTGPAVHADELETFLAAVPPHVMVILDEAYVEFVRDPQAPDGLAVYAAHPNVVLLRTFSKAYGLAALRVGYAVARPDLAAGVRAVATPFGVGDLAQRAAVASLAAEDELLDRVETLVAERTRVTDALRSQGWHERGWDVPDAQGNFVWLPLGSLAADFGACARAAGVLVRPFAGDGVRVSIGSVEEDDAFLRVATDWLATHTR